MANLWVKCLRCDGSGSIGADGRTGLMLCPFCVRGFVETGWAEGRFSQMQATIDKLHVMIDSVATDGSNLKDLFRYAESHTKEIHVSKDREAHRKEKK